MKCKKKLIKRLFSTLLSSLTFSGISVSANIDKELKQEVKNEMRLEDIKMPKRCYLTKEKAIKDINNVINEIKKYYSYELPKEVKEQLELEIKNLTEKVSDVEEWRITSRILSKFHDRRIGVSALSYFYYMIFPFSYDKNFTCTSGEFKNYKIVEINGISIDKIYDNFKKHFSYDDEEWTRKNFFCEYKVGHYLTHLNTPLENFARGGVDVFSPLKIKFQKGNEVIEKEIKMPYYDAVNWKWSNNLISFDIDTGNKIATLTLDDYIKSQIDYKVAIDKFFEDVQKNKIKNIIIDFRCSPGYAYDLLDYLSLYIRDNREKNEKIESTKNELDCENKIKNPFYGDIYIAVSEKTSGGAVYWTEDYQFKNNVTVVGESCSDVDLSPLTETLDHMINTKSGLSFFYPVVISEWAMDPGCIKNVYPDIETNAKEAIRTIYEQIKLKSEGKEMSKKKNMKIIETNARTIYEQIKMSKKKNMKINKGTRPKFKNLLILLPRL